MNKKLFINGQWIIGDGKQFNVVNPADERIITQLNEASEEQTKEAITAARKAFDETNWSKDKDKRIQVLRIAAKRLEDNLEEFAKIESIHSGKPIRETRMDIDDSVSCLRYYANLVHSRENWSKEMADGSVSTVIPEPIGVCSLI